MFFRKFLIFILLQLRAIVLQPIDFIVSWLHLFGASQIKNESHKNKNLLIVRLDAIGDYIIFRNFIELIKKDGRYKGYKITLCGNIIWKDLSESFDSTYIDNFIWIDRKKFFSIKNICYRYNLLRKINEEKFDVAIQPVFLREFHFGEAIMRVCRAREKIGIKGNTELMYYWEKKLVNLPYTKLIDTGNKNLFEFYKNKIFFEKVMETAVDIQKPFFNIQKEKNIDIPEPYIVIFPGASRKSREWAPENFANISEHIHNKFNLNIVIAGSKSDYKLAKIISSDVKSTKPFDMTGKTSLKELVNLINGGKLLVTNDTCALHIGVAVSTPTICISSGMSYSRFHPYPEEVYNKCYTIYPEEIIKILKNKNMEDYYNLYSDINLIYPSKVNEIIDQLFN